MNSDFDENTSPPPPGPPPLAGKRSALVPLIEAALVLALAFGTSLLLGLVALVATTFLAEGGDPMAALFEQERKLEIQLIPADDVDSPPTLEQTRSTVVSLFEKADLILVPNEDRSWDLVAWIDGDPSEIQLAGLASELHAMGWVDVAPQMTTQPRYFSAMQNPRRMRLYIPPTMTLQALSLIVFAVLVLRWRKPPAFVPVAPRTTAIAWGAGSAVAAFMASTVVGLLMHLTNLQVEEQAWIRALMADRLSLLTLLPWLVVIGPLSEEVFFRGYVFRRVRFQSGPALAYAASALLFALIHWHPVGFPMYAIIGLVFCWVYQRTGSLWAPVTGHMVYNAFVVGMPLLVPAAP